MLAITQSKSLVRENTGVLSMREKIGYGLGDAASNIVFQTVVSFLGFYYTDIYGLSAATVGTVFLAVRVLDAVIDPLMGMIADRTRSRWGRYRPWLLWIAVPFGASAVITFTVPQLGPAAKQWYAFATYSLLMIMYTAINIPYCALGSVLTDEPRERVAVQSWRFALAMGGGLIVTAGTLPLVDLLGGGDRARGYQSAMLVFAALAVAMFVACFATTSERVHANVARQSGSLAGDVRALFANDQWRLLALVNFMLLVGIVMRGTVTLYFVNYVMQRPDLATAYLTYGTVGGIVGSLLAGRIAGGFDARSVGLILLANAALAILFVALGVAPVSFAATSVAAGAIATLVAAMLARRYDKTRVFTALQVLQALVHVPLFFMGTTQVHASFGLFVLILMLNQIAVPLLWSMMSDCVDYGEWKTGVRTDGLNFSATLFALKLGMAVGGALAGWLLAWFEYVPNAAQSPRALLGITLTFTLLPGVVCLLVAAVSLAYGLTERRLTDLRMQRGASLAPTEAA